MVSKEEQERLEWVRRTREKLEKLPPDKRAAEMERLKRARDEAVKLMKEHDAKGWAQRQVEIKESLTRAAQRKAQDAAQFIADLDRLGASPDRKIIKARDELLKAVAAMKRKPNRGTFERVMAATDGLAKAQGKRPDFKDKAARRKFLDDAASMTFGSGTKRGRSWGQRLFGSWGEGR